MGAPINRLLLGLAVLGCLGMAEGVEVCRVADLSLVTQTGEFFLAVTFLGMGVTTIIFVLMMLKAASEKRKFYFVTCYCCGIATFAYYAMLSGQGWLISPSCRQLFYVRYLDWFFTTPLLLIDLALIAGADWTYVAAVVGGDMMMIFGGYMASISSGHIKWLWFAISLLIFAPIIYTVLHTFKVLVERSHPAVGELYNKCSWLLVVTWACYPVVFIFSEGTADWSPNFEVMIYGVLDLMAKCVFGFILLLSHEALDRSTNPPRFASIAGGTATAYGTQMQEQKPVESYIG
nr:protein 106 [synthetic construct]